MDYGVVQKTKDTGVMTMCINDSETLDCKPDHPDFITLLQSSIGKEAIDLDHEDVKLYLDPDDRPDSCFNELYKSYFVQYSCVLSETQLRKKFNRICMVMATGILSCLLFLVACRKVILSEAIQMVEW